MISPFCLPGPLGPKFGGCETASDRLLFCCSGVVAALSVGLVFALMLLPLLSFLCVGGGGPISSIDLIGAWLIPDALVPAIEAWRGMESLATSSMLRTGERGEVVGDDPRRGGAVPREPLEPRGRCGARFMPSMSSRTARRSSSRTASMDIVCRFAILAAVVESGL